MIYLKNLKFTGALMFTGTGGSPVVTPEPEECVISTRSHLTNSVRAVHTPTAATATQRGAPGTTWYVQVARWTTPFGTDINQYAIEPGPIQLYLNGYLLPFDGVSDYQKTIGELVQVISGVTGWIAYLDYVQDPQTNEFSDEVIVIAYTAGAPKKGLEIAYPQDSTGQTQPHPAVELLFNGAWRHGAPVDGECKPLVPADYAQVKWTFPGGVSYDETGGMGETGETSSTADTRASVASAGRTYPSLTSTVGSLTPSSPVTALGLDTTTNDRFEIGIFSEGSYQYASYNVYDETATIQDMISELNYTADVLCGLDNGHFVILNTSPDATTANAFDRTGEGNALLFGEQDAVLAYAWVLNTSINQFELSTTLTRFAPKGIMEFAINPGYPTDPISVGFVSGKGAALQPGQTALATIGDLIAAINAVDGGNTARAYLDNGRLVVAILDLTNEPYVALVARYVDAELFQGQTGGFREAAELMYGASDYRNGASFRYDDQFVATSLVNAYSLSIFTNTVPARTVIPAYDPTRDQDVKLGTRTISTSDKLSKFYPIGYILQPYQTIYGNTYQGAAIEISADNTIQDALNYFAARVGTFRLVDGTGIHQEAIGFLRMTGNGAAVIWTDPATRHFGEAIRLFEDKLDDGMVPTNVSGQL
jgi:hypothetical protein